MSREVVLAGENLSLGYRLSRSSVRTVADNISCKVEKGEMISLIGPNGIGKSTLLRTLSGLQSPLSGCVKLCGKHINLHTSAQRALLLSVVLTDRIQIGAMKVFSIVALGRYPHTPWTGSLRREDREVVEMSLAVTETDGLKNRYFSELSDGEKQKVMIARAIAQEPTILILDEPTAFLDLPRRVEIVSILKKLTRQKNIAVLLSTHDLDLALKTADRLWILSGNTLSIGAPEDLVLNGSLETAFSGHGLTFNPKDGQFVMHEPHGTTIHVTGEGLEAIWTRRALERDGYSISDGVGEPLVRIENGTDDSRRWILSSHGDEQSCVSIRDLLIILETKIRP